MTWRRVFVSINNPLVLSVIGNLVLAVALGMMTVHHYHTTKEKGETIE
jgi:hypothetical protein